MFQIARYHHREDCIFVLIDPELHRYDPHSDTLVMELTIICLCNSGDKSMGASDCGRGHLYTFSHTVHGCNSICKQWAFK